MGTGHLHCKDESLSHVYTALQRINKSEIQHSAIMSTHGRSESDEEKAHATHHSPITSDHPKLEGGHNLTHAHTASTIQNKRTFGFVMTMLGFSISFVVAEVIPLFLITLFTVIAYDLNSGDKAIWLIVAQFIAVGSTVPFVGPLVDLLGRKWTTLVSLLFTVVSMILLGTTQNIAGAIASMVISGMGIGIRLLTSIAAVTELVPVSQRGITIGYKPPPRVNSLGLTKRQVLGRIDFIGAFLAISGVTLFLVGLNWGEQPYAWNSAHVVACMTVGLGLLVIFVVYEKFFAPYPLFPGELIQHPRLFFVICFLCLTSGVNFIPVVVFWTIQCYTVYGASFRDAGIWLLPIGFCIAGGAIISAGLMTVFKTKIHWILLGFCVIQTAGLFSAYAANFNITDPENIAAIQQAGHELYKTAFPELYLVSIAFGGAAIISCFFLKGISAFINENVAVHLG